MLGPVARRARLRTRGLRSLAAGAGVLGVLGMGAIGAQAQILPLATPTPTTLLPLATPTPTALLPSPTLCVLVICLPGGDTGTQSNPTPTPSGSQCQVACLPTVSPNPSCSVTIDPTSCLVQSGPTPCQTDCGGKGGGTNSPSAGSSPSGSSSSRPSASSLFGGGGGGLGGDGGGTTQAGAGATVPLGLSVASVPAVEQLGPASGLQFGHAPILWPLFGALDLVALIAVAFVVRRLRSAGSD